MSQNSEIVSTFCHIRTEHFSFDRKELPKNICNLVKKESDLEDLFQIALSYWQDIFNQIIFEEKLKKYIDTEPKERSDNLKKYFKIIRKAALILGSACHFFTDQPTLPKNFIYFIRYLGKINDAFALKQQIGNKYAQRLVAIVEVSDLSKIVFCATSIQEYQQRLSLFINSISDFQNQEEMLTCDFHTMRKNLRYVMNLYQILAVLHQENFHVLQTFQYLCQLNSDLGKVREKYVEQELLENNDDETEIIKVPDELKMRIKNFLDWFNSNYEKSV